VAAGLPPDPLGSLSAPTDPLYSRNQRGPTSKGREEKEREEEREGRER